MPEAAFRISGRVQGVGFRMWTRAHATRLGIEGSVRNAADGSVEVRARGSDAALSELRRLLGAGPPGARVDQVVDLEVGGGDATGFVIAR